MHQRMGSTGSIVWEIEGKREWGVGNRRYRELIIRVVGYWRCDYIGKLIFIGETY